MSKIVCRVTPVNGYDIPGLERWLEKQAAKGLIFAMTVGVFTLFERKAPVSLRFHLEPAPDKPDRTDPELNALYEEAGWQYLGLFRSSFAVFSTENREAQAHTDPEVWSYALKRFFRRKLLGGVGLAILNFVLLSFFWSSRFDLFELRYFWAEALAAGFVPWALAALGLALADLAYLHGLFVLWRLHRRTKRDLPMTPAPGSRLSGVLAALSAIPLFLVAVELIFLFATHGYFPYDLADSNFVTLTEIEGEDFRLTGDRMHNMDYISHGDTPLTPENWFFQQWGTSRVFSEGGSLNNIPHLEIQITRYLFPPVAERRVFEWQAWGGHENYMALEPVCGFDEISINRFLSPREGLPCTYLVLRRGSTVLRVEYQGEQDLTQFLPRFAEMLEQL